MRLLQLQRARVADLPIVLARACRRQLRLVVHRSNDFRYARTPLAWWHSQHGLLSTRRPRLDFDTTHRGVAMSGSP